MELNEAMSNKIPEQRDLLCQLMASEERYQNFMNAATDAIFIHDLSGLILDVNNAACIALGYTRQELINSYAWKIEIAITRDAIQQNILKLANGPINLEGRHRRKDGTTFPVDVRVSVYTSMGEQLVLAIVRDITNQKDTESTIRKLTRALDQSPVLIVITDKAGTIEYVNTKVVEQTDYSTNGIVGKNFRILQSEKTLENVYNSIWEQLVIGKEWHGALLIKNKNGDYFEVSAIISPIRDEKNQEITHYLAIMEAISTKN